MKKYILFLLLVCCTTSLTGQNIQQIENDLLDLPEMENLGVMLISEPDIDEPYYTFKAVEPHGDHLTTLYWFHIYTKPQYKIKVYDIATDAEYSLEEWRKTRQTLTEAPHDCSNGKLMNHYTSPDLGYDINVENGEVFLHFDLQKMKQSPYLQSIDIGTVHESNKVRGLSAPCKGIFVGDIGQDVNPMLCMLLENGKVEILSIMNALKSENHFGFFSSGCLPDLDDIVRFEAGGGGPYEAEGEIRYSYRTIYAIDKQEQRHEIETFLPEGNAIYLADDQLDYKLTLSPDWKIELKETQGNGQSTTLWGRFQALNHNDDYSVFELEYQTLNLIEVEEKSSTLGKIGGAQGRFKLDITDFNSWKISPHQHPFLPEDDFIPFYHP